MAKISRRDFLKVSSLAAAGVVLAACGQATQAPTDTPAPVVQPTAAPQATAAPAATATSAPKPTAAPAATATPAGPKRPTTWPIADNAIPRNRTLIYTYGVSTPGAFNVYASNWNHQDGGACMMEPAAFYAAHADKTYMWLAESAKPNADATQWTIVFRKGIKWSDGVAFTAHDPEWAMNMLKTGKGLNRQGLYVKELVNAVKIDDLTLQVNFNQPDWRFFFTSLTFRFDLGDDTAIQPAHIFEGMADADLIKFVNFDTAKGLPVTTSAYGCSKSTDQSCNFDLHPTWWAVETGFVPAYPDVWRITTMAGTTDTASAQGLINNEFDQTLDVRPLVAASCMAQAGDHLTTWTGNKPPYGYMDWWPISIYFNNMQPPWDNPDVHWAVAYAIDQQAVVDTAWAGAGVVSNRPYPAGFAKLNAYMDGIKDLTDKYNVLEFNLDKSAALMTKAGFKKDKDGFWVDKDGKRPQSDLYAAVPLFGDLGPVVVEQLRTAGFDSQHKVPPDVWAAMTDGRANMFLFGHGGSTMDPLDTLQLYRKKDIVPLGTQSWNNIAKWWNADWEKITDTMVNTPMDDPKMKDLFHQAMEIYYVNLPDCPLVQWFHRIPVNTTYWSNWPSAQNPYMNSALWHQTMLVVLLGLKATNHA